MRWWIVILVVLLGAVQYSLWFGERNLRQLWTRQDRAAALAEKIRELEARNRRLRAEVKDLRRGGEAIVERAREDLGMIGQGEIFIRMVQPRRGPEGAGQGASPGRGREGDAAGSTEEGDGREAATAR